MRNIKPRKPKNKIQITIECNDETGFNLACKVIARDIFKRNRKKGINAISDFTLRFQVDDPPEDLGELIDYRFERHIIEGKETVVMVLKSKMNDEQ